MRDKKQIDDRLIERAAEIWARAIQSTQYDNGDNSIQGVMTEGLAAMNLKAALEKVEDFPAAVEKFRTELIAILKYSRDHEGEPMSEADRAEFWGDRELRFEPTYSLECYLSTDYNPCQTLAIAADRAGLPHAVFSWKSTVYINQNSVSCSFGYGRPDVMHYPLPEGRWLITDIRANETAPGSDMAKVIDAVLAGRLDLEVEKPESQQA